MIDLVVCSLFVCLDSEFGYIDEVLLWLFQKGS